VKEALTQGYNVVATARNTENAEKALGNHPNLLIVKLDVTNQEEVKQSVAAATERFGQIDVLVNNAGYGLLGYFEEMSEKAIHRQMETNLFGTMKVTRAILPVMRRQGTIFIFQKGSQSGIYWCSNLSHIYPQNNFLLFY
ncbi:MAG: SDR family NAD(P)-dependent oxidoreductase, partial [Tannerellaceae bacterium]|nr:SDR family NAD(P)-dependent oxidoreductase [Tannerellaceae bacterium]